MILFSIRDVMHLDSLFIILPGLISGIWTTAESSLELITFQLSSQRYNLFNGSNNILSDIAVCSARAQQLALFETQQEYAAVDNYLSLYFNGHAIVSGTILIDMNIVAAPSANGSCYSWKNDTFHGTINVYSGCFNCRGNPCFTFMVWKSSHFLLTRMQSEMSYLVMCKGTNLCSRANCSQDCRETNNKYECYCRIGYTLSGNGYSCDDSDECVTATRHPCTDARHQTCVNTKGSFKCECISGYRQSNHGDTCVDIDECVEVGVLCEHKCVNTEGSYNCTCMQGYILAGDNKTCHDVDECLLYDTPPCDQICNNTVGSYTCECHTGFQLSVDNHTCNDIDECMSGLHPSTISNVNNYICQGDQNCSKIFPHKKHFTTVNPNNETHASEEILNKCQGLCHNSRGSYYCTCPQGFKLAADHSSCVKSDHHEMLCPCSSLTTARRTNKSDPAVEQAMKELMKDLTVSNKETAYFVRRKTSALDKRGTSPTTAIIGIVFLATALVLIVFLDISQAAHILLCKILNTRIRWRKNIEELL